MALSEAVEKTNLSPVVALLDCLIKDDGVLGVFLSINGAGDVGAGDFDPVRQDHLFIQLSALEHIKTHRHVVNVIDGKFELL